MTSGIRMLKATRRSKKGLSGAITALILVIASVIIALIVVLYVFGLIPGLTSSTTQVTQIGPAYLYESNGDLILNATLSVGSKVEVIGMVVAGSSLSAQSVYIVSNNQATLTPGLIGGTASYQMIFTASSIPKLAVGQTYTVELVLSNGVTTTISATYIGST
ncbi:MAG: hypothetical protein OWQ54_10165 [Sulfolobaceae archaeon]|nr:hypothetical protein [Sulfolobaceae archaeon]